MMANADTSAGVQRDGVYCFRPCSHGGMTACCIDGETALLNRNTDCLTVPQIAVTLIGLNPCQPKTECSVWSFPS